MPARTEGQRLLRAYLDKHGVTQRALAQRLKRSEPTISLWLSGGNVPDIKSAIALDDEVGIPPRAWTKPARNKPPRLTAA